MMFCLVQIALTGVLLVIGPERRARYWNVHAFQILLVLSLGPLLGHSHWVTSTSGGWGEGLPFGEFRGLAAYRIYVPLASVLLSAVAIWLADQRPMVVSTLPLFFFVLSMLAMRTLLFWRAPDEFFVVDNMPSAVFAFSSICTTAMLSIYSSAAVANDENSGQPGRSGGLG